eukprot:Phypoly_transcript_19185.p1 GENE.Phypoly_transcript_19185~~Phypoly_transcript_19185.p1  ORF type:complete len:220 (+),score=65.89 Phypoly_transcript_19185:69-662(+)
MKRHHLVLGFQNDPSIKVCLLSLLAGAEGITLTVSRKLYHVDPWWNPAKSTQASDRVHRIGQERDVEIVHLHVADTIEDSIRELQEKKKRVASAVMGEEKVTEDMTWANEIKLLFQLTNNGPTGPGPVRGEGGGGGGETMEFSMDEDTGFGSFYRPSRRTTSSSVSSSFPSSSSSFSTTSSSSSASSSSPSSSRPLP